MPVSRTIGVSLFCFASLAASPALAGHGVTAEFRWIPGGFGANDMSPDGRWVVGLGDSDGNGSIDSVYRYDADNDVMLWIPGGFDATGVSDDGSVIVGCMPDPGDGVEVAARWTQGTGWTSLGWLPDALNCPSRSNAYEVSANGAVVTGLSWDGCSGRAFVWTQGTGMLELEALANGSNRASVMSADGTRFGGFAQGSFSRTPCFWDDDLTGTLLDPPDGDALGEVHAISDDGTVMMGTWDGAASTWTTPDNVLIRTPIGDGSLIPGWTGIPLDIDDAGTIVGFDILLTTRRAWIRPAGEDDLVLFQTWVGDHGGEVPVGLMLEVCQAISADGSRIIGHGNFTGAWIIDISPACAPDLTGDGVVGPADLAMLLDNWGPNPGHPADFNGDGDVGPPDLALLLDSWGDCS